MKRSALSLALLVTAFAVTGCHTETPTESPPPPQEPAVAHAAPSGPSGLVTHEVGQGRRAMILLHGYGAQGDDLVPLARSLPVDDVHFYLPEAPILMPHGGRRWFGRRAEGATAEELTASRDAIVALIESIAAGGVPLSEIYLGGFSQGAMLTFDVAVDLAARGKQLGGLILLSGSTMPHWPLDELGIRTRVLITHGRSDTVLPFAEAERMRDALLAGGSDVEWVPFDGGHSIPVMARGASAEFLSAGRPLN